MNAGANSPPEFTVRRACHIEDLPDDLAELLDAGLDDLWNPETVAEEDDKLIS